MKRINYFTLAALAMLSLAGCTQDDERAANGLPMTGMPLRPVVDVDAPVTREAMTTETLDHYYFRVTDQAGSATTRYDYFVEMTKDEGGTWSLADGYEEMTWQSAFPRVSAMEQKGETWDKEDYTTGKTVSVQTDQSTHDNLLKSDLLYMASTNVTAEGLDDENNIKVNLKHLFAKLKVVVTVNGVPFNPIKSLVIGGTKTQARFTPETGVLGEATNEATITACQDGTTNNYECILLPQDVAANTLTVNVTLSDGSTKSYTYPNPLELKSNYQYTLSLTMQANMTMTPGDVTMEEGWSDGVVDGEMEEGAEIIDNTYYVKTATGLLQWANAAAEGRNPNLILTKDIDMAGKTWPFIGDYSDGTIDGGGHTISNLMITPGDKSVGLIANEASDCTIKNLTLWKPSIDKLEGEEEEGSGAPEVDSDLPPVATPVATETPTVKNQFLRASNSINRYGFFVGYEANDITMINCHVIEGVCNWQFEEMGGFNKGGLVASASGGTYTACSVISSRVSLIGEESADDIIACYVVGGKLIDKNPSEDALASYYQENTDGSITAVGDDTPEASTWSEAMEAMNEALSDEDYEYQWVVNTVTDDDPRPIVIKTQPTN